jgi:hypothetical protein
MSVLKVLAGFLIGAVAGAALALALCVAAAEIFGISQMEGAYAMQVAFFYMPFGALMGGIIGAIWLAVRRKRPS